MNSVLPRPAELSIAQVLQSERGRLIKSQESNRWSLWREWYLPWWKQVPGESFWLYKAARQLESEFTLASNGSLGLRQSLHNGILPLSAITQKHTSATQEMNSPRARGGTPLREKEIINIATCWCSTTGQHSQNIYVQTVSQLGFIVFSGSRGGHFL